MSSLPIRVLFVCTTNSCCSQMAEAWLRHLGGGRFVVRSGGTDPSHLDPVARRVMDEVGVGIASQRGKGLDAFVSETFDLAVTLCDNAQGAVDRFGRITRIEHTTIELSATKLGTTAPPPLPRKIAVPICWPPLVSSMTFAVVALLKTRSTMLSPVRSPIAAMLNWPPAVDWKALVTTGFAISLRSNRSIRRVPAKSSKKRSSSPSASTSPLPW